MELADDVEPRSGEDGRSKIEDGNAQAELPGHPPSSILDPRSYIPKTLARELHSRGRLPFEECVPLGISLSLALGHLHRHGLIHRDVKPSNIIFVNGVPKLADIGLVTDLAEAQSFVGTEGFIPPEGPNSAQADIYALGKVLYEAAMGKDRHEFPEPFTGLGVDAESQALMELNEVLLKACAAKPKQRYQSAEEMNADLALLHSGQSVRDKHALQRRLKITTRVAVAVVAAMVLGVVPYYLAIKEARVAKKEAAKSQQVAQFLTDMLKGVGPSVALGRDTKMLREILDKTAERVGKDLTNQPEVEIDLLGTVGELYDALGEPSKVEGIFRERLALQRKLWGEENLDVSESLNNLAIALEREGKYAEAEPLFRKALALRRKLLGNENLRVARSLQNLGGCFLNRGNFAEAEPPLREALAMNRKLLGNDCPEVANSLADVAKVLFEQSKLPEAESLDRQVLAMERNFVGNENPQIIRPLNSLARVLNAQGKSPEAESLYREALAMARKFLDPEHPEVARSLHNLASALRNEGKVAEAEQMVREGLAMERKRLGNENPAVASSLNTLAKVLFDQGKLPEAEAMFREALAMRKKLLGNEHPDVASSLNQLAVTLNDQGKLSEAESLYREALAMRKKLLGNEHPAVASSLNNLANVLKDQGKLAEAETMQREALALQRKLYGDESLDVASKLADLTFTLLTEEKFAEAEAPARECLAIREAKMPDDWRTFNTRTVLGASLLGRKKYMEAEPLLLSGYEGMKQREDKISAAGKPRLKEALQRLVQLYEATGRPEKAAEWKQKLEAFNKAEAEKKAATPQP
jgi:eukaryotic-like serine/threonine-protein kinase